MNKLRKVILILLIYIGLIFINTNVYATNGTTIKSTTRLRKEASTESAIVTLMPENAKVEIISKEGDWYKVTYKENDKILNGFIRQDMLKVEDNIETETNSEKNDENTINNEENGLKSEENLLKEGSVCNIKNSTIVRILPSINSTLLEEVGANSQIKVVEIINKWCKIETETTSGWSLLSKIEIENSDSKEIEETKQEEVQKQEETQEENKEEEKKEEPKVETKTLYVNTETVNMRENADTNSRILRQLSLNTTVEVLEQVDNTWSKVSKSGVVGFIASKYLSETKTEVTSRAMQESRTTDGTETGNETTEKKENSPKVETTTASVEVTTKGEEVVNYAKQYLGYKYVAGGGSPSSGFDCSGFTSYVYKHFGYSLSRTASGQLSNGKEVSSKSELQLGDVVCFKGHVGIYIGGNQFIHAANPKKGVVITSLSDSYYTANYITSRRILN